MEELEKQEIEKTLRVLHKKSFVNLNVIYSTIFLGVSVLGLTLIVLDINLLICLLGIFLYSTSAIFFFENGAKRIKKALAKYPKMCKYAKRDAKKDEKVREMLEKVKEWDNTYDIVTSYNKSIDSIEVVGLSKKYYPSILIKASRSKLLADRKVDLNRTLMESSKEIKPMKQPELVQSEVKTRAKKR